MRRCAVAAVTAALVLGVSAAGGSWLAGPGQPGQAGPGLVQRGLISPRPGQRGPGPGGRPYAAVSDVTSTKTIEYGGYVIDVPATWRVHELAAQPHLCVRYDRHAVYLGHPGPDQRCPAHLVGRTESVRIDGAAVAAAATFQRGAGATGDAQDRPARPRVIVRDTVGHELGLIIARPGLSVTATYANDPAVVERIIGSVRAASRAPGPSRPVPGLPHTGPGRPPGRPHAAPGHPHRAPGRVSRAPGRPPARRSVIAALALPARARTGAHAQVQDHSYRVHRPVAGFDTCTAPSIAAMRAWRPFYKAVAIYIGGANMACDQGNLSAQWVRRAKAMGWDLIPAYVGLQPPCDRFGGKIRPGRAAREGAAAASDAVALARGLRLRRHAPIYFDMEGYNAAKKRCRRAVLIFLDAWTRRIRALGYTSGVYSSAGSGAQDLGAAHSIAGHRLARPETIWFALWDGRRNLRGAPYLLDSWWPANRRIKQFRGDRWQRHGRFRLDIDRDEVFGAVY